jgi:hypothetical protein
MTAAAAPSSRIDEAENWAEKRKFYIRKAGFYAQHILYY